MSLPHVPLCEQHMILWLQNVVVTCLHMHHDPKLCAGSFWLTKVLFRPTEVLFRLAKVLFRLAEVWFRLTEVLFRLAKVLFRLAEGLFRLAEVLFRLAEVLFRLAEVLLGLTKVQVRPTQSVSLQVYSLHLLHVNSVMHVKFGNLLCTWLIQITWFHVQDSRKENLGIRYFKKDRF